MVTLEDLLVANLALRRNPGALDALRGMLVAADQAPERVPLARSLADRQAVSLDEAKALHEGARRKLRQRAEEFYLGLLRREGLPVNLDQLAQEQAQAGWSWTLGERLVQGQVLAPPRHDQLQREANRLLAEDEARLVEQNRQTGFAQCLGRGATQALGGAGGPRPLGASGPDARLWASTEDRRAPGPQMPAMAPMTPTGGDPSASRRTGAAPGTDPSGSVSRRTGAAPGTDPNGTSGRRQATRLAPEPVRAAAAPDPEMTMHLPNGGIGAIIDGPADPDLTLRAPPGGFGAMPGGAADPDLTLRTPPGGLGRPGGPADPADAPTMAPGGPPPGQPRPLDGSNRGPSGPTSRPAPPPGATGRRQAQEPSKTAFAGRVIDQKYEIVRELGRGNMGIVFLARELIPGPTQGRAVAMKVVQGPANAEARGRFKREILVSQRVQHPHVIEVYGAGELENGSSYMVMEVLEGEPLSALIKRDGAQPVARAVDLFEQILRGLEAVHNNGVVHRDMKPENVHACPAKEGGPAGGLHLKLVDFGISRFVGGEQEQEQEQVFVTVRGTLSGTPQYVAPEAVLDPEVVATTHDVYAAGVILYELLTGQLPFPPARSLKDILADTLNTRPRDLAESHPGGAPYPPPLERFVRRMLEKDPELRPGDATKTLAALADLRAELSGAPPKAKAPAAGDRPATEGFTSRLLKSITGLFRRGS